MDLNYHRAHQQHRTFLWAAATLFVLITLAMLGVLLFIYFKAA